MIKVLHVLSAVGSGGVETMLLNYYKRLDKNHVHFDLVAHSENSNIMARDFEKLGSHVFYITGQRVNIRKNQKELKKILLVGGYDVIHFHHGILSLGVRIAKRYSPQSKIIIHSHGSYEPSFVVRFLKFFLRIFIKKYGDYFCACSNAAARYAFGLKFVKRGKVVIIHNAIDVKRFQFSQQSRTRLEEEYGIKSNELCIGVVGRLSSPKNPFFTVELANELRKIDFKFRLLWIGEGELRGVIEKRIFQYDLKDNIVLCGVKKNVNEYYSVFDVFILPSMNEGLGIVAIEAQQNGVPVLVSDKVPREVVLTNNCKSLPLDLEIWRNEIISINTTKRHVVKDFEIGMLGYDIEKESVKLLNFYKTVSGNNH